MNNFGRRKEVKKSKIFVNAVSLALLLSGCGGKKPQAPEGYQELFTGGSFDEYMVWTTDDEQYSDLISQLSAKCENILEGSLMVATDDKVIYAGGWNSIETDGETRVNPFTTYEIGSVTKQMTAACILQQVQAGNLKTDETIDKYFPEFPYAHKITIDNLLHMDSGIVDYVNNPYKFYKGTGTNAATKFTDGKMTDEEIKEYIAFLYEKSPFKWIERDAPLRYLDTFKYHMMDSYNFVNSSFPQYGDNDIQVMIPNDPWCDTPYCETYFPNDIANILANENI